MNLETEGRREIVRVCVFEHRHGRDIWACRTEDDAYRELAGVCREFWDEAREVAASCLPDPEGEPFPTEPPTGDRDAVERYFAAMIDAPCAESYEIAACEVIGASEGATP